MLPSDSGGLATILSGAKKRIGRSAFTLVEILVSVSVLSLMILFLFSVFNLASQAWQSSERKVDAFREARAALFVIRRDLSGLQVADRLPLALNQALVPNLGTLSSNSDQLFLVSTLSPDAQGGSASGELCALGYYVGWATNSFYSTNSNFANQSFNLFRYFQSSASNYSNLTNFWDGFLIPTSYQPINLRKLYANASTLSQSGDEVLARNVVGFRIKPYYWQTTTNVVLGVTNITTALASTNTDATANSVVFTNKPAFFDVSMTVVNYATAAQMGPSIPGWNQKIADSSPASLVNQNKQEFYVRVPLTP